MLFFFERDTKKEEEIINELECLSLLMIRFFAAIADGKFLLCMRKKIAMFLIWSLCIHGILPQIGRQI